MVWEDFYPERFNVSSENLGLCQLIIDSAGYIDFKMRGKKTDLFKINPTKRLSELLRNFANNLKNDPRSVDGDGILALWETLREYEDNKDIRYTDELALKTSLVAQELRNFEYLPKNRIETLIKFCCDLSKEISRYSQPTASYLAA